MTVNNMINVRFQITDKQTDDELKARFMCRFPKAMTRAYSGNQPFNDYTLSRLFKVETEDPRGAESFSLDLGQALGTTTDVGVPVERDWWDDYSESNNQPSIDQVNTLAALVFDPVAVPPDHIRWLNLSLLCRCLEATSESHEDFRMGSRRYLAMSETEVRIDVYRWLSNFYFKKAAHTLPRPASPWAWDYREEFKLDYQRFVAEDRKQAEGPFVENSMLFRALCVGPVAVSKLMRNLQSRTEQLENALADPANIDKDNFQSDETRNPVTLEDLAALKETCVLFQQEIRSQFPEHWINSIREEKIHDALDVRFWVESESAVNFLSREFLSRYPDVRIEKKVGYRRDVKTYALAFLVQRDPNNQDDWKKLNKFTTELREELPISSLRDGIATPAHSGDWDQSCDGIADFSESNMIWETAKLAYDPHAAPIDGLRAVLIYDVLVNHENERFESIKKIGSASEQYLRAAGLQMISYHAERQLDDPLEDTLVRDHQRFVMNGRQQAPGAFLLESAVLKKSGVTLRRAIHHMDVEVPEAHSESFFDLEVDLFGNLESDGSDNHDISGGY